MANRLSGYTQMADISMKRNDARFLLLFWVAVKRSCKCFAIHNGYIEYLQIKVV